MKLKILSFQLPAPLLLVVVLLVIGDMHLQEAGALQLYDLLIIFFLSAFLIQFGFKGLFSSLIIVFYLFFFQYSLQYRNSGYLPISVERIQVLHGVLSDDPVWMGSHSLRLKMDCTYVDGSEGIQGAADCPVCIFIQRKSIKQDGSVIGRGTEIRVSGRFSISSGGKDEWIFNGKSLSIESNAPLGERRLKLLARIRAKCSLISRDTEVLLPALVLGMDHPSKKQFSELFRKSGTAHIMALSGFHAGLVGVLLFLAGHILFGTRGGYIISMGGLVIFLWLVGFRPSLVRAVSMYLLFGLGKLTQRSFNGLNVLFFSYLVHGLLDPSSINSLSSQLSYLALAGIMISGSRMNTILEGIIPIWLRLPLCASLGAQLWTSALVLTVFGKSYPIGIMASLVLTPLVTLYLYVGIFWLFFPGFRFFKFLFGGILIPLERILQVCAEFFGHFKPVEAIITTAGPFLLFLIPVLLLEFYRPGVFIHGKRKAGFEL
ncbi:MAG: hypothetical protein B6241_00670 [Spirochaetaceae bacterium 4572_59]|nr:MAG: hypothetical protein B6241_00670 [Spirochaetaceae bacterium 4572_59]